MATYTVKSGDTLSAIAKKNSTTVHTLMALNKFIKDKNKISVGWVLTLPAGSPATGSSSAADLPELLNDLLDKVEALPEFKQLEALIYGDRN